MLLLRASSVPYGTAAPQLYRLGTFKFRILAVDHSVPGFNQDVLSLHNFVSAALPALTTIQASCLRGYSYSCCLAAIEESYLGAIVRPLKAPHTMPSGSGSVLKLPHATFRRQAKQPGEL